MPAEKKETKLFAFESFVVNGAVYDKGSLFTPPATWRRAANAEELLHGASRKARKIGVVFEYDGKIINPNGHNTDLQERLIHRVILPLEEK